MRVRALTELSVGLDRTWMALKSFSTSLFLRVDKQHICGCVFGDLLYSDGLLILIFAMRFLPTHQRWVRLPIHPSFHTTRTSQVGSPLTMPHAYRKAMAIPHKKQPLIKRKN